MGIDFKNGIVRILHRQKKTTVGTGFVLNGEGFIATCAHVVDDALVAPDGQIDIVFYATQERLQPRTQSSDAPDVTYRDPYEGQIIQTAIVKYFLHQSAEDVAILQLVDKKLPDSVLPLRCIHSYNLEGKNLTTFGFPEAKPVEGLDAILHVVSYNTENKYPIIQLKSTELSTGFSGAPIWDADRNGVVGMATSIIGSRVVKITANATLNVPYDKDWRQTDSGAATPIETVNAVFPVLDVTECPYLGLNAFTRNDAKYFFGRKEVIDTLVKSLKDDPPFLAVFGPSGSGKSSVVQAGLIPKLEDGKFPELPGSKDWGSIIVRPLDDPFKQLAQLGLNESDDPMEKVLLWLQENNKTRLLLVIDQFEELFVKCTELVRQKFLVQLARLLDAADYHPIRVIILVRDEFYGELGRQEMLLKWLNAPTIRIPLTLPPEEVEAIVREPARQVYVFFEDGLVDLIKKDVMEVVALPGGKAVGSSTIRSTILPLLEFTLKLLWEKSEGSAVLRSTVYNDIGGVARSLVKWADQIGNDFKDKDKEWSLVRRIFTDMVHVGDKSQGRPDTRKRVPLSSLYRNENERDRVVRMVRTIEERYLLTTSSDEQTRERMVEIAHETLLRNWDTLGRWIEDDRTFLLWRQKLDERMQEWKAIKAEDSTEQADYKMFEGAELRAAVIYWTNRSTDLNQEQQDFIRASLRRQDQKEYSEQLDKQQAVDRELRRLRTRRAIIGGIIGGLVVMAPSFSSLTGREKAESQHWFDRQGIQDYPPYLGHQGVGSVQCVAWLPDGKRIVCGASDRRVDVFDAANGGNVLLYHGHDRTVTGVACSPDGKWIASSSNDKTVQVWNARDGKQYNKFTGHTVDVHCVSWSSDSKFVASGSYDCTVRVWDVVTKVQKHSLIGHSDGVWKVAWSPDGKHIVSAGNDKTLRVWEVASEKTRFIYKGHTDAVYGVSWSPNGAYIASCGRDSQVHVWRPFTGEVVYIYEGHPAIVDTVAWSPDGQRIASSGGDDSTSRHTSDDHDVQVWDALTGAYPLFYQGHILRVHDIAWSPDGNHIASASFDGTVQIWRPI